MVSKKIIIVLITLAILLSAFSIAMTFSTSGTDKVPEIKIIPGETIPDIDKGQVSITIDKPVSTP